MPVYICYPSHEKLLTSIRNNLLRKRYTVTLHVCGRGLYKENHMNHNLSGVIARSSMMAKTAFANKTIIPSLHVYYLANKNLIY